MKRWISPPVSWRGRPIRGVSRSLTVYCTAMIYASLTTIHAWCNGWTIACYMILSLMTAALAINALDHIWRFGESGSFTTVVVVVLLAGYGIKRAYWRYIDGTHAESNAETATGLGGIGKVRLFQGPHTELNYLNKEMGYRIARKHARRLRLIAGVLGFQLPFLLILFSLALPGWIGSIAAIAAFAAGAVGIVVERWLFFAEAKHVVNLYYGASEA